MFNLALYYSQLGIIPYNFHEVFHVKSLRSADSIVWNLDDLYRDPEDPALRKDRAAVLQEAQAFAGQYRNRLAELSPAQLAEAFERLESIEARNKKIKAYAELFWAADRSNGRAGSLLSTIRSHSSQVARHLSFFARESGGFSDIQEQRLSGHRRLSAKKQYFRRQRRMARHRLSECAEQALGDKSLVSRSAWIDLYDATVAGLRFGSAGRTMQEVLADMYHASRSVRRRASGELAGGVQPALRVFGHVLNSIALDREIDDRLRGFSSWIEERNLLNEVSQDMVRALVGAVRGRQDIIMRYYRLKKNILGYDMLYEYDRPAPVCEEHGRTHLSWEQACSAVREAFHAFSPEISDTAGMFFNNPWIHAAVSQGKAAGAFSHPTTTTCHPYILLNFTGSPQDLLTLAHETGHAVHQLQARDRGPLLAEPSLIIAEIPAAFAELLVIQWNLGKTGCSGEKLFWLCLLIERCIMTVFRQTALYCFEDRVHRGIRRYGRLTHEEISELWMEEQEALYGSSVRLSKDFHSGWVQVPHFFQSPGYVYAYSLAWLSALGIHERYQDGGERFVNDFRDFLCAGGSAHALDLLGLLGCAPDDSEVFNSGLSVLERYIAKAEQYAQVCSGKSAP